MNADANDAAQPVPAEDGALSATGAAAEDQGVPATGAAVDDQGVPATGAAVDDQGVPATGAAADEGREPLRGLDEMDRLADEVLPALIARLGASRLGELEIRHGGWRVRLRRSTEPSADVPAGRADGSRSGRLAGGRPEVVALAGGARPASVRQLVAVGPGGDGGAHDGHPGATRPEPLRMPARAPAVGYYAPRDGIAVGHSVRAGDVLGHVDVLGVRQEVVAPADGFVGRLIAEPGEAVEYGQELVRVDIVARSAERSREADTAGADGRPAGG